MVLIELITTECLSFDVYDFSLQVCYLDYCDCAIGFIVALISFCRYQSSLYSVAKRHSVLFLQMMGAYNGELSLVNFGAVFLSFSYVGYFDYQGN